MNLQFFPSRWPIMCAVMNGVSDLNLALAVHDAGAMPSLMVEVHKDNGVTLDLDLLDYSLKQFVSHTGGSKLILATSEDPILDTNFLKIVNKYKVSHLELLIDRSLDSQYRYDPKFTLGLKFIKSTTKIMSRLFAGREHNSKLIVDAYCLKGSESAGVAGSVSIGDLFDQQQKLTGNQVALIPYGGIGTPQQVKEYIARGAAAVAVGTLFAASTESCLSIETKQAMCAAQSKNIVQLQGTGQNALILGNEEDVQNDQGGGWNRQNSLNIGIHGDGTQGHIYAGKSIDYVTSIRSVKEIVEYLTSELSRKGD